MSDDFEPSTNSMMKKLLAKEPIIPPPKGYPGRKVAMTAEEKIEVEFQLWDRKRERREK